MPLLIFFFIFLLSSCRINFPPYLIDNLSKNEFSYILDQKGPLGIPQLQIIAIPPNTTFISFRICTDSTRENCIIDTTDRAVTYLLKAQDDAKLRFVDVRVCQSLGQCTDWEGSKELDLPYAKNYQKFLGLKAKTLDLAMEKNSYQGSPEEFIRSSFMDTKEVSHLTTDKLKIRANALSGLIARLLQNSPDAPLALDSFIPLLGQDLLNILGELASRNESISLRLPSFLAPMQYVDREQNLDLLLVNSEEKTPVTFFPQIHRVGDHVSQEAKLSQEAIFRAIQAEIKKLPKGAQISIFDETAFFDSRFPKVFTDLRLQVETIKILATKEPTADLLGEWGAIPFLMAKYPKQIKIVPTEMKGTGSMNELIEKLWSDPSYVAKKNTYLKYLESLHPDDYNAYLDAKNIYDTKFPNGTVMEAELMLYGREISVIEQIQKYVSLNPKSRIFLVYGAAHDFTTYNSITDLAVRFILAEGFKIYESTYRYGVDYTDIMKEFTSLSESEKFLRDKIFEKYQGVKAQGRILLDKSKQARMDVSPDLSVSTTQRLNRDWLLIKATIGAVAISTITVTLLLSWQMKQKKSGLQLFENSDDLRREFQQIYLSESFQ